MIQHDSSYHLWSPYADKKWYLITSLDDYSRYILYGDLWLSESAWAHIVAVNSVISASGIPFKYYVDNHSIFRFVEKRDSLYKKYHTAESEAFVQWKEVLKDLKVDITYALSPQAKGKIERPYRWLQDHLVRICARDNVKQIDQARAILKQELHEYNFRRVHSTTGEIPVKRFEHAIKEKKSLFRSFEINPPFKSIHDICCFRYERIVDQYHRISLKNLEFGFKELPIGQKVELRISPEPESGLLIVRFWYKGQFFKQSKIKREDIPGVHF